MSDPFIKLGVEALFQSSQRLLVVHFEFTDHCNRRCTYCIEGNGEPDYKPEPFSDESKILTLIDKIYQRVKPEDCVLFILAGGEPTTQPALPAVIRKILTRNDSHVFLTTNFTQSEEFYRKLDVPLIISLHLEKNDIDAFIAKAEKLFDLIGHVRVMACPEKLAEFKYAYEKIRDHPLRFNHAAARLHNSFKNYVPHYSAEYDAYISTTKDLTQGNYPESLKQKLGLAQHFFDGPIWWDLIDGKVQVSKFRSGHTNGMHCEKNLISIEKSGKLWMTWCDNHDHLNAYEIKELPLNLFSNAICDKPLCYYGYLATLPKYKLKELEPVYLKKKASI